MPNPLVQRAFLLKRSTILQGTAVLLSSLILHAVLAASAARVAATEPDKTPSQIAVKSVHKIWDQAPHNAFTSLLRHHGKWYCTFREAEVHAVGPAAARVIISEDGDAWTCAAVLREEGIDARDPHRSITSSGELMLLSARATQAGRDRSFESVVRFSKDGKQWTDPVVVGDQGYWLWSAAWHDGACYSIGYKYAEPYSARVYRSTDGRKFETLVEDLGIRKYPNESSIVFDEGDTAYCLLRCGGPAQFGTAKAPYKEWKWIDTGVPVGGPALIKLPGGRWIAAGRSYSKPESKTALWWVDPAAGRLTKALVLPSGADTSYPGLVWHDDGLWVSYYSSHEGKSSIYLAKVAITDSNAVSVNATPSQPADNPANDEQVARWMAK